MMKMVTILHLVSFGKKVTLLSSADVSKPKIFQDAVSGYDEAHWLKGTLAKMDSMQLHGVYRSAKLSTEQQAIETEWVLKIKRKADGLIEKYNARLVEKRFK